MQAWIPLLLAAGLVGGCASSPQVPEAVLAELAPGGRLHAGMNLGNALFTTKDPRTGELTGVSVDLMRELGWRLGVPVEFVVFGTPGEVADAVDTGQWDVAILAIEPARAERIAFSPAMTEIEATYLVHEDSPLHSASQADAPGIRIAAPHKAGYELYLARTLRHAKLESTKNAASAVEMFNAGKVHALAGLRPALLESMGRTPHARLLDGNFMIVNHGLATPRDRRAGAAYLEAFVEEMKASGFVARSIERHAVKGLAAVR